MNPGDEVPYKPEIWSQELRAAYEKALVFVSLCNRDYEGEIADSPVANVVADCRAAYAVRRVARNA